MSESNEVGRGLFAKPEVSTQATKYHGFHHVEFWVGNAKQSATYYITRFGFHAFAYRGLETGHRDFASHVVRLGNIFFVFTSPLTTENASFAAHIERHGDGVRDVAFICDDARAAFAKAVAEGAEAIREPWEESDENGVVVFASVRTYGDTVHTFVQKDGYSGDFLPNYSLASMDDPVNSLLPNVELLKIDHVVGNQGWNEMSIVEQWYIQKLGFHRYWSVDENQIHTEYSALRSVVMTDDDETIVMPINEPAVGKRKSQIEEYCDFYGGAGVQHIALLTNDILTTISNLRARGMDFLSVPKSYYDNLRFRLSQSPTQVQEDLDRVEELNILVDFDDQGYLLQLFTKPLEDRPTLFIEIIQRRNHNGFGVGNFKALFESIELDQAKRGTL